MFCGVAHQCVDGPHHLAKILLVGNTAAPIGIACGLAILVVNVNQVDITGDVELTGSELTHAHDTKVGPRSLGRQGCAVLRVQQTAALLKGYIQRAFGQSGHGGGYGGQRGAFVAIQADQALHYQLPKCSERCASICATGAQCFK